MAEEITGWKRKEVIGKSYMEILKITDEQGAKNLGKISCPVDKAYRTKRLVIFSNHVCLTSKQGKRIPVAEIVTPILDKNSKVIKVAVVFRDVTREEAIDKMKTEFAGTVSHQLRTPISAIKWYLDMLLSEDIGKLSIKQKDFLKSVYVSNERMVALINDFLSVSRIEAEKMRIEVKQKISVGKAIEDVIIELNTLIKKKKVDFQYNKPKKSLPLIIADRNLLKQLISNLISNAVKYTPEKKRARVDIKKTDNNLLLIIADQGVGIPENQQKRVFSKFFRGSNVIKMETEGTGLGLYIAKSIVTLLNGKIWFKSTEGKGTTFYVSLPINNKNYA